MAVIACAVEKYQRLPGNLKLSVHSGSDKFSIYPAIRQALEKSGAGVHLKTAGTTWLEELIGLAEAGGDGLALAKEIYAKAYAAREALCEPYTAVIEAIDPGRTPGTIRGVRVDLEKDFTSALRHEPRCPRFRNPSLRQLLHVGFKIAAGKWATATCAWWRPARPPSPATSRRICSSATSGRYFFDWFRFAANSPTKPSSTTPEPGDTNAAAAPRRSRSGRRASSRL